MVRTKTDIERRERAIALVFRQETGRFVPPKVCRPFAEMAFLCGEDRTAPAERDFLARMRTHIRYLKDKGLDVSHMGIEAPSLWRLAQDMHHAEIKRASTVRRDGVVATELARLSSKLEDS